jgi:hypothetical protein
MKPRCHLVLLALGAVSVSLTAQPVEIGPSLTLVGNPFLSQFPAGSANSSARTIRDLKVYAGHVWIANGDTSTGAPLDLYALRLADQAFVRMKQNFPQEMIREFREFDGRLYIASPDEAGSGKPNFTVIDGTTITTTDITAPSNWFLGAHNEDIYALNNGQTLLFPVATSLANTPANTLISTNGGASWRFATGVPTGGSGPYRFMAFNGVVYASQLAGTYNYSTATDFLYKYTPGGPADFAKVYSSPQAAGLPNTSPFAYNLLANPHAEFAGALYYLSSSRLWRITQMEPQIITTEIPLLSPYPAGARVQDLFVHNGALYALVNEVIGSGSSQQHRANIFKSADGFSWSHLYRFTTATNNAVTAFARTADAFYFGYGGSYNGAIPANAETGNLYRLAVESDGTTPGLPPAPALPPTTPPPYVLDDFDTTRNATFGASGSGTTATRIDYDTTDADLELRVNRTSNSGFTALAAANIPRTGAPITQLRDGTSLSVRVIGKAAASSANFTVRWAVSTDAWTSGSGTYRAFTSATVSATAATNTLLTLNLSANPSVSAAAANYLAGNGTYFQLVLDNGGFPTFAGALEFALDDVLIGTPTPAAPAAPTGFLALATPTDPTRAVLIWNPLTVATTGFLLERSTNSGPYTTVGTFSGLSTGTIDTGLTPGAATTYRLRTYAGGYSTAVTVDPIQPSTQAQWRQVYFGTATNTGTAAPTADPDGDGLANLLEYALNTHPLVANTAPSSSLTPSLPHSLQLTFLRARADLTYIVEASDTLAADSWTVIATNPGTVGQSVTVTDSAPASPRRFIRLRVVE